MAKVQPPLVMAAELIETTRLWARTVAGIHVDQIEDVGQHLMRRQYSEPHWSASSGSVFAYETVTLYGVPIVSGRRVGYGKINPAGAREIFLRSALVEGQWRTRHPFFSHNAQIRAEAESLEERTRRRDLVADDQAIYSFYDARVPSDVVSAAHFDSWWSRAPQAQRDRLTMTLDDLMITAEEVDDQVLPRDVEGRRSVAHDQLRVRAGKRPRRRERDHSGRGAQPGSRCAVQLAGARAARRAGHGARPVAAEGQAEAVCPRSGYRASGARLARRPSRRSVGVASTGVGQSAADAHR